MIEILSGIAIFALGFFLGVFERKVDRIVVKMPALLEKLLPGPGGEILKTPSPAELKKQSDKEFHDAIGAAAENRITWDGTTLSIK